MDKWPGQKSGTEGGQSASNISATGTGSDDEKTPVAGPSVTTGSTATAGSASATDRTGTSGTTERTGESDASRAADRGSGSGTARTLDPESEAGTPRDTKTDGHTGGTTGGTTGESRTAGSTTTAGTTGAHRSPAGEDGTSKTADDASVAGVSGTDPDRRVAGTPASKPAAAASAHSTEQFVDSGRSERLHEQWRDIQSGFVDDPRDAVRQADELAGEVLKVLTDSVTERKRKLDEGLRSGGGEPDTERLRLALHGYREFVTRVLSV